MKINYLLDPQLINVCEEFDIDSTTVAINGGEDYIFYPYVKILIKLKEILISPSLDI
jgi:hypothetical protein